MPKGFSNQPQRLVAAAFFVLNGAAEKAFGINVPREALGQFDPRSDN